MYCLKLVQTSIAIYCQYCQETRKILHKSNVQLIYLKQWKSRFTGIINQQHSKMVSTSYLWCGLEVQLSVHSWIIYISSVGEGPLNNTSILSCYVVHCWLSWNRICLPINHVVRSFKKPMFETAISSSGECETRIQFFQMEATIKSNHYHLLASQQQLPLCTLVVTILGCLFFSTLLAGQQVIMIWLDCWLDQKGLLPAFHFP